MQGARDFVTNSVMKKTKRHGVIRAPFASVPFGRSTIVFVPSARPATATGCLTALSSRDSGLFAGEFVRGPFLVGGPSTFRSDCALRLRIHRRESAWSLATRATGAWLRFAPNSRSAHDSVDSFARSAATSAPLIHPDLLVVGMVCHYQSPAAIFRVCQSRCSTSNRPEGDPRLSEYSVRKRQAAIFGRGRPSLYSLRNVDFCFSRTCVRLMIKEARRRGLARTRAAACLGNFYSPLPPAGCRHVVNPVRGRE